MKLETSIQGEAKSAGAVNAELLSQGFEGLRPLLEKSQNLKAALMRLGKIGDKATMRAARRLHHQLKHTEPSITMIGQVKAGKTSLVNAMVGWPGLLPADVNPWTSVVTSLHLSPHIAASENRASFRFFDMEEWSRLLDRGGRIGELASRAGAEDELAKVREQVAEMRQKSRERLGDKFELLLGKQHDYGYFDDDLIERYVCLGDDFEDDYETSQNQGRFADITKSAEVFMNRPEFPMPLCIRDTPGVNDTFMIREQITIRAIRESRICVVVLAAHQALSSVDMALIRLIANVKSREVLIVVNRVDELSDPVNQIPEIRESIKRTLAAHDGPKGAEILFTSAYWANSALSGTVDGLDEASAVALGKWAEADQGIDLTDLSPEEQAWKLSGLPSLYAALSERIVEGVGQEAIDRIAKNAMNLANGIKASDRVVRRRAEDSGLPPLDRDQIEAELSQIEGVAQKALQRLLDDAVADFHKRLDRAHRSFLERATGSLLQHLEMQGEDELWQYDPTGLRILLRTAYQVFGRNIQGVTKKVMAETAAEYVSLYHRLFDVGEDGFGIAPPPPPRIPSPVLLGQTIALDLKGSWWSRWWHKRRGYRAFATDFAEMIKAETDPIVQGLRTAHVETIKEEAATLFRDFTAEQRAILGRVAAQADGTVDQASALGAADASGARREALNETLAALTEVAA